MATNNTSKNQCQGSQLKSFQNQQPQQQQSSLPQPHNVNYEPLEKSTSNTLKVSKLNEVLSYYLSV